MGARLSALADAVHVIACAAAADDAAGAASPYILVAGGGSAGRREINHKITAPAGQWSTGRGRGVPANVVLSRSARPGDMLQVGLDTTFYHLILLAEHGSIDDNQHGTIFHVTNLTPVSECNPTSGRTFTRRSSAALRPRRRRRRRRH
jgi:hypothetical protein